MVPEVVDELTEPEAKTVLSAYGIPTVETRSAMATTAAANVAAVVAGGAPLNPVTA